MSKSLVKSVKISSQSESPASQASEAAAETNAPSINAVWLWDVPLFDAAAGWDEMPALAAVAELLAAEEDDDD